MANRKKNLWTSTSEVLLWLLFAALVFPAAFVGYAVGHYTSLGKPPATVTTTVNVPTTVTSATTSSSVTTTTSSSVTTTTSSSGGNAAAGKAVFTDNCATCHTFSAAGATGTFGPNLDTAIAADAQANGNMALDAFIRESITDPGAYIAKGYSDGMPGDFGTTLTPTQIDDLVAFIVSGTSP